jgi:threonine aldolase
MIDLRSDTVTRPSPEMRRMIAEAEVGDDVFGDDPTVQRLERLAAQLLGKPAALFVPSGTMANQVAVRVVCRPGDEVLCDPDVHLYRYEGGGAAANSGVTLHVLPGDRGLVPVSDLEAAIAPADDPHLCRTRMIWLENTHNRGGGRVLPLDYIQEVRALATRRNLHFHCDGARLFNAAVALGLPAAELARPFDSLSICLSKGLGAPIGSIVLGSEAFIEQARRARKALGGGMRQAGLIAAGGIYALEHNIERLAEDHRRARELAASLAELPHLEVQPPETNILLVRLQRPGWNAERLLAALAAQDVHAVAFGPQIVRFVTHLDVDDRDIAAAAAAFRRVWSSA